MRRRTKIIGAFAAAGLLAAGVVFAQGTGSVNPPTGSIWTYFGPTFGAAWAPPVGPAACVNIAAYGAVGDGVVDNTAAFNAAKIASSCLNFPAGKFRFNSAINYTFTADKKSVRICGMGSDVTELTFPNAVTNALTITLVGPENSFHVCDLTMSTGTLNADTGIFANQTMTSATLAQSGFAPSDVNRVVFRSSEGYASTTPAEPVITKGWKYGFRSSNVSMVDFGEVHFFGPTPAANYHVQGGTGGTGIQVAGDQSTLAPVVFNVSKSTFNWLENGLIYGNWIEGVTVSQSNFTGCYIGVSVPANVGTFGMGHLAITTSQFNDTYGVKLEGSIPDVLINNNLFYSHAGGSGIEVKVKSVMTHIIGNAFNGTQPSPEGIGVSFTPDVSDDVGPIITSNSFYLLADGVRFNNDFSNGAIVGSNRWKAVINPILNLANSGVFEITGAYGSASGPVVYANVTGAANNGSGSVRLTVNSTTNFVNGQVVLVSGVGGLSGIGGAAMASMAIVIDATHMDLRNIGFAGTYTGGGWVSSLPP